MRRKSVLLLLVCQAMLVVGLATVVNVSLPSGVLADGNGTNPPPVEDPPDTSDLGDSVGCDGQSDLQGSTPWEVIFLSVLIQTL